MKAKTEEKTISDSSFEICPEVSRQDAGGTKKERKFMPLRRSALEEFS